MSKVKIPDGHRIVLYGFSWDEYVRFSDAIGERPHRVTYDGHRLELRQLSSWHWRAICVLRRIYMVLTMEFDLSILSLGSMTCRRADVQQALESDECYWIENASRVRGRTDIDLAKVPPPDR